MSGSLLDDWEREAKIAQVNFCAIEVGEAAESDSELPTLLRTNVPSGASVYIMLSEECVPDDEVEQLRAVLHQQEIPLAWAAPLNPENASDWALPPVLWSGPPADEAFEHPAPSAGARAFHSHDVADRINDRYLYEKALELELKNRMLTFEQSENSALIAATIKLRESRGVKLSLRPAIIDAFNKLQVTTAWQARRDTKGAQVLRDLLIDIRLEEHIQGDVEGPLQDLFLALANDADVLHAVLNAAAQLPRDLESTAAVSTIYIAYMELRVALGKLDDKPKVARDFACRVQRYHLMEEIAQHLLKEMQDSLTDDGREEEQFVNALDKALMAILLNGGEPDLPPMAGKGPMADAITKAWREMKQRGNEQFGQFLDQWAPWQGLVRRRQERLKAERESRVVNN